MSYYLQRERQLPPPGRENLVGFGMLPPAAQVLGLGTVGRMIQGDRLRVDAAPQAAPVRFMLERYMDPRTLDATRVLDAGAPAVGRLVEYAPDPYRPTEAPDTFQNEMPLGGRRVLVLPPGV